MTREDKLFLSWLSPRGIVAAAVASIFAEEMALAGQPGGDALRAMVFVVIGATVVIQGISGGWVAQWLGVKRGQGEGWVILSAGAVAQALASVLECDGQPVVLVDSNLVSCSEASEAGYQVVYGNAFEARTLARAGLPNKRGVLSLSPNYEVNALFARKALAELTQGRAAAAMNTHRRGVGSRLLERDGLPVLFGGPRDLDHWGTEFREREVTVEVWAPGPGAKGLEHCAAERWFWECLPVGVDRGTRIDPYVGEALTDESECAILLAVPEQSRPLVHRGLAEAGWLPSNLDAQSDSPGEQGAASA